MDISGNTVFIPGATSGIGLALALRLRDAGSTVVVGGRRTELLERIRAEHGLGVVTVDTADPASILAARDDVLDRYPTLDVLVAMAGIMPFEDVRTAGFLADAERTVTTNVLGPIRLLAAFVEHLRTRPAATFVTVSSGLAHVPLAPTPTYNGSKAFVHRWSETLRLQLAGTGVQVIEIVPPAVRTELTPGGSQNEAYLGLDEYVDEVVQLLTEQPDATEILVRAVGFLRHAEVEGRYDAAVAAVNSHGA